MDLPEHLVSDSSLTPAQLESLIAYHLVVSGQLTLKQAAGMRQRGPVRVGSFYRTVQQGRKNISASIVTLIIALWMEFVDPEDLRRLLDQVGKKLPSIEQYEMERLTAVIKDIVERIVI
jgi:hypothetical protein